MTFKDLDLFFKIYICFISFFFGMCMGSFLNCLAYRVSNNLSIINGRSRCDYCHHELAIKDLIPIFSYLQTKGRCRYCHHKLDRKYLVSEVLCGTIYALTVIRYGISLSCVQYLILNSLLICASFFYLEKHTIYNQIIIIGIINRIIFCFLSKNFIDYILISLRNALIITLPLIILISIIKKKTIKEIVFSFDIKLIFMSSMYLSTLNSLIALAFAYFLNFLYIQIINKQNVHYDFGLFICFGYIISILIGSNYA